MAISLREVEETIARGNAIAERPRLDSLTPEEMQERLREHVALSVWPRFTGTMRDFAIGVRAANRSIQGLGKVMRRLNARKEHGRRTPKYLAKGGVRK